MGGPREGTPSTLEGLLDACIHCGLCLQTCPTYLVTGAEAESPRGRLLLMKGLEAGRWKAEPGVLAHLDLCLGCRACETACPSGVRYGEILETVRGRLEARGRPPRDRLERVLVSSVFPRGRLLERLAPLYRALRPWRWERGLRRLPLGASWRRRLRLLPEAERPPRRPAEPRGTGPEALLLRGCVARALYPATERAMVDLLTLAGYRVRILESPECCGALEHHLGLGEASRRRGEELREALAGHEDAILVPTAAGCGAHLEGLGPAARVRDLSEALLAAPVPLRFRPGLPVAVTLQDACHLRHGRGVAEAPRELLRRAGAVLHEAMDPDLCCGSAGTYNLARDALAAELGARKAAALREAGGECIVTMNPGCAIQLGAHLGEGDPPVRTFARFLLERCAPAASVSAEASGVVQSLVLDRREERRS